MVVKGGEKVFDNYFKYFLIRSKHIYAFQMVRHWNFFFVLISLRDFMIMNCPELAEAKLDLFEVKVVAFRLASVCILSMYLEV